MIVGGECFRQKLLLAHGHIILCVDEDDSYRIISGCYHGN